MLDNSSTHKVPTIQRWLVRHPRFTLHFTAHLLQLDESDRVLVRELVTKWLRRGTHRSVRELIASIRTWVTDWNDDPKPFLWHKTADETLDSLSAYCQRISDSWTLGERSIALEWRATGTTIGRHHGWMTCLSPTGRREP
jgi:hypothetical protein